MAFARGNAAILGTTDRRGQWWAMPHGIPGIYGSGGNEE
jgi:hypothetical protein